MPHDLIEEHRDARVPLAQRQRLLLEDVHVDLEARFGVKDVERKPVADREDDGIQRYVERIGTERRDKRGLTAGEGLDDLQPFEARAFARGLMGLPA